METQFVPFELAVKLKELGFDEKCFMSYFKLLRHEFEDFRSSSKITFNEDEPIKLLTFSNDEFCKIQCGAPLWQQAFEYFLNFKGMHGTVLYSYNGFFYYTISFIGSKTNNIISYDANNINGARYACLEKLIELCK